MDVVIRRVRLADLGRIAALERAGFGRYAWPRDLFLEYLEGNSGLFLVAEVEARVAAYIIASRRGRRGEIVSIAVDPAIRRAGLGRTLVAAAINRLRRRGVQRLSLMVKVTNRAATAFWARLGFRRARRVRAYYEDGRDGWLMTRRFPAR